MGSDGYTLVVSVQQNDSGQARTGSIDLYGLESNSSKQVLINQSA